MNLPNLNLIDPVVFLPDQENEYNFAITETFYKYAVGINSREISYYPENEIFSGQYYFTAGNPQRFRNVFRKVINIGALAAGATYNQAHNITDATMFTKIYGSCVTDTPDFRNIPYASATVVTNQIEARATSTNLIVVNGATSPNLTSCYIVLEYLKE